MPQRHKESRDIKDLQDLSTSQCHKLLNRIFLTFGFLQKSNLAMPKRHKESRDIKDLQELSTSECHKHLNRIFLTFGLLAKNKFGNATTPQGIARYLRLARVGKQVKFQCHKLLKRIFLTFGLLAKNNLAMPQRHKESRDIKDLQDLSTSQCHKFLNRIFLTFGFLQKSNLAMLQLSLIHI